MAEGFFTKKQTESTTRPDGKVYSCASCGLYKNANTPKMLPYGNFKKGILNIGETPNKTQDIKGNSIHHKGLLQQTYESLGIDLYEDCLNINAVNCHTTQTPTNYEIDCCRKYVLEIIKKYKPKLIIILGNSALYSLVGHKWKKKLGGIHKWRGFIIPDQDYKCWICPVYHPSFVIRAEKEVETIWKQDLKRCFAGINSNAPFLQFFPYVEPDIEFITDLSILNNIQSNIVVIDYETTGLKPHAKGHKIICISVAVNENKCFVFMLPKKRKDLKPYLDLLKNKKIKKVAHNIKFEDAWSMVRLRQKINNWHGDTMLAAHIEDNRPGINSLKFQTYIKFGIVGYDSDVNPYLRSDEKDGNSINSIEKLVNDVSGGKEMLMKYCGLDTIFTYRLFLEQIKN